MSELRFDGKSVLVTGAGRGVGRGHALLLASRGARVVVADIGGQLDGSGSSAEPAEQVVDEIRTAGGEAVACHASIAEVEGAAAIVNAAVDSFGGLDIVINNAGIHDPGAFTDLSLENFQRMLNVHYLGVVYVLKAAWPHLKKSGSGRVVNTCSEGMAGMHPNVSSYGAAKGSVMGLTLCLSTECEKDGIRVNAVAPRAATRLADLNTLVEAYGITLEQAKAIMAPFTPEAVAPVAAYLAHESCELNGVVLATGGGQVQRMALMESEGIKIEGLTIEDVASNIDTVTDLSNAQILSGH
jgi:NAD(P)-dependent dehydrogenase (short-subunit alcohol dehydrogenase family)